MMAISQSRGATWQMICILSASSGPPIEGADAYIYAMRRLDAQQTVLKCLAEHDEVACFYELSLPTRPDVSLFGCGRFKIEHDRIKSVRVVFDPTPLGKA